MGPGEWRNRGRIIAQPRHEIPSDFEDGENCTPKCGGTGGNPGGGTFLVSRSEVEGGVPSAAEAVPFPIKVKIKSQSQRQRAGAPAQNNQNNQNQDSFASLCRVRGRGMICATEDRIGNSD
jgi:hypothetical protein